MNKSRSVPIVIFKCRDYTHARHVIKRLLYPNPGIRTFDFFSLFLFDRSSSLSLSLLYYTQLYNIYTTDIYIYITYSQQTRSAVEKNGERTNYTHTNIPRIQIYSHVFTFCPAMFISENLRGNYVLRITIIASRRQCHIRQSTKVLALSRKMKLATPGSPRSRCTHRRKSRKTKNCIRISICICNY